MRVLLVNPSAPSGFQTWHPPLGLGYLSSYAKKHIPNLETQCCDMSKGQALIPQLNAFKPDVIGVTASTLQFNNAKLIGEKLRRNGYQKPLVLGGSHISALPQTLPKQYDACIIGEGERAFVNLLDHVDEYGICYPDTRFSAPLIENLDEIPMPDRSIFDMKEYLRDDTHQWAGSEGRGTSMITSRGCLYRCIFCPSSRIWGNPRGHSPKRVIEEIEFLVNTYSIKYLNIWDDLFLYDKERVRQIADLFEAKGFNIKVGICGAHAPTFDEESAQILKRMNVVYAAFGFETMNPETLKWLKAGVATPEDNRRAVAICKKYKIMVGSGFLYNIPNEKPYDRELNNRFAVESEMESFNHYVLTPFPGTPLWDYALKRKLVSLDMDWTRLAQNEDGGKNIRLTDKGETPNA